MTLTSGSRGNIKAGGKADPKPKPLVDPRFPGAMYQYWYQVPPRCSHCQGIWRQVSDGMACLNCGRSAVVSQALIETMRLDRWLKTGERGGFV